MRVLLRYCNTCGSTMEGLKTMVQQIPEGQSVAQVCVCVCVCVCVFCVSW